MARFALARFGTSRRALGVRTAPFVLLLITAGVTVGACPEFAVTRLTGAVVLVALLGIVQPREPVPTLSMLLVIIDYAVATRALSPSERVLTGLLELTALYAIHSCYAVAVAVRFGARVDPSVLRVLVRRVGQTLCVALPIAAGSALVGEHAPRVLWLGLLGVVAGLALTGVPFIALRRR